MIKKTLSNSVCILFENSMVFLLDSQFFCSSFNERNNLFGSIKYKFICLNNILLNLSIQNITLNIIKWNLKMIKKNI